jgi:hypothetical protein
MMKDCSNYGGLFLVPPMDPAERRFRRKLRRQVRRSVTDAKVKCLREIGRFSELWLRRSWRA